MSTNTANWVVTERIKLTQEQVHQLLRGEEIKIRIGTNLMGQTLCTKIEVKRKP